MPAAATKETARLLKEVVEAKLRASGALAHVKKGGIGTNALGFSSENSLLLEFQGLSASAKYRILVSFLPIDVKAPDFPRKAGTCRASLQLDLILLWTKEDFTADALYSFKAAGVHILTEFPTPSNGAPFEQIPDFIHVPQIPYDELLNLNNLAHAIAKRLRKKFHLVLSEVAASSYSSYGTFATKETMKYEDGILKKCLKSLLGSARGALAIDMGCGDGRHTRVLAQHFQHVVAFDLSKRMIEEAQKKDRAQVPADAGRIAYYECDIEYEGLPGEHEFMGKADFVCASFGMPSFVEDTVGFLRRVYLWLRPGGRALFTFYNAHSLSLGVSTPWKERALSASIDVQRQALEVQLREDARYSIYCRPFDDKVRDFVNSAFTVLEQASFPHVMALLPPSLFGTDENPNVIARQTFSHIDRSVARDKEPNRGHYTFLIANKAKVDRDGHLRVRRALEELGVEYSVIDHTEVLSTNQVKDLLRLTAVEMVKTVIFRRTDTGAQIAALVSADRLVDRYALATAIGCSPDRLALSPGTEVVSRLGFPLGGVAPTGFAEPTPTYVDRSVTEERSAFVYMGAGDNRKTIRMTTSAFKKLASHLIIADIQGPKTPEA